MGGRDHSMSCSRCGALTFADWNALRVLVDDHADAALARVLVAEKHGQPADGARVACGHAERLQRKVRAAFRASGELDDA